MAQIREEGGDLESMSSFGNFSTSVWPEWSLCRGQLAVPGQTSWLQSKNVSHISWPHLDAQVESFEVGVIPGILNFDVAWGSFTYSHVFIICNTLCLGTSQDMIQEKSKGYPLFVHLDFVCHAHATPSGFWNRVDLRALFKDLSPQLAKKHLKKITDFLKTSDFWNLF